MAMLNVQLFGRFSVELERQPVPGLEARKVQELFSYLVLNRGRPHPRESLAAVLWGEASTTQSRKYLRQGLWQLQAGLDAVADCKVIEVDNDWVRLSSHAEVSLDVARFEGLVTTGQASGREAINDDHARRLEEAVAMYRGDLLEGWYADWCLFERERLQQLYLAALDSLMIHCERSQAYDRGCGYGELLFRYDPARERTHRQVMRLRYLAGDRTGALRQYERCASALDAELGVAPARRTTQLYEQIRTDRLEDDSRDNRHPTGPQLTQLLLNRLRHVRETIADLERQIQRDLDVVERDLRQRT